MRTIYKALRFADKINLAGMLGRAVGVALDSWRQAKQEFKTEASRVYDYRLGMEFALMISPVRNLGKFPRNWNIKHWKQALMKILDR